MEALLFRHDLVRYLASRLTFRFSRKIWSARYAPLRHVNLDPPRLTRPGWTSLHVLASGICGSDLNVLTGQESLYLAPEATYPFIPGHELVGKVGSAVRGLRGGKPIEVQPGDRVAVWPMLGCAAHGVSPSCSACDTGWEGLCKRRHGAWPGPGLGIGFNCETGGGWSERCLAHVTQLWPLPLGVRDEDALLLDPASAALAALLRTDPGEPAATLVIGGGTVGLLTAWLHAQLGLGGTCELLVRHEFQRLWAAGHQLSAAVVANERDFPDWATERAMSFHHVAGYGRAYEGVYDRVIDAAGTQTSLAWALRSVRPRGTVVLLTAPADSKGIDFTPVWHREISVRGVYQYGPVPWQDDWLHPYEVLIPRLADGTLRLRDLITHEFPLREYVAALAAAVGRERSQAIKVIFRLSGHP